MGRVRHVTTGGAGGGGGGGGRGGGGVLTWRGWSLTLE